MTLTLPRKLTEVILGLDAERGREWLAALPATVGEIANDWALSVGEPFPNLSYHFVAPCVCADGSPAVLKIGFPPERKTLVNEAKMLDFAAGRGLARLLRFDAARCALLLERLTPGDDLKKICGKSDDLAAAGIAAGVMRRLWREPPEGHDFQRLDDWFLGLQKAELTEFRGAKLSEGRRAYEHLKSPSKKELLLHGDLHHENILSAGREPFLAIDPKGIVGDPGYETSTFLINHANWLRGEPDLGGRLKLAARVLAEGLETEPRVLLKWTFAQAVLSAWWTFEENCENWRRELDFAGFWLGLD